jgi:hypothetical protein
MHRPIRALLAASLTIALLAPVAGASAQSPTTPKFTKEDYSVFLTQLNSGQVAAVTFNKKAHTLHITTRDGKLYLASYDSPQWKSIEAQIKAKGVPVTIEKVKKAGSTTTTTHHKLRYIAAGVLVLVVIVIAVVLGFNRRRPPAAEPGAADAPAASGPPAGE